MIDQERHGEIILLRVQHGKVNAIDTELCLEIVEALDRLREFEGALVITGAGTAFSAGVDLKRVLDGGADYIRQFLPALKRALLMLFEFSRPVIAAVNGHAIAGGCIIACACDHRLMAAGSGRIGVPELLVGVPFPALALEIVRFAVPRQHIQNLVYSGQTLTADEALRVGLVDEVVPAGTLIERALEVARKRAAIHAGVYGLAKRQLRAPSMKQIEEYSLRDDEVLKHWTSPGTHAVIRQYLERTIRR